MPFTGNSSGSGSRRSPSSPPRYSGPPPPPSSNYGYGSGSGSGGYGRSQGRGYGGGSSGPSMVGWTPRGPGNIRSGGGRGRPTGNLRSGPSSGSRSAPPQTEPGANGTPSWLKGGYRTPKHNLQGSTTHGGGVGSTKSNAEQTVEAWCKARLEAIRDTVDGGDAIPELKKVMQDLEFEKIEIEADIARKARRERWRADQALSKSENEHHAVLRPLRKIDYASQHVESKLERLKSYSLFIDNNWKDESEVVEQDENPTES